jgi:hypothetical protein
VQDSETQMVQRYESTANFILFFFGFVTLEVQNGSSCLGLYSIFLLSFEPISVKIAARPVQML